MIANHILPLITSQYRGSLRGGASPLFLLFPLPAREGGRGDGKSPSKIDKIVINVCLFQIDMPIAPRLNWLKSLNEKEAKVCPNLKKSAAAWPKN
jgi:hypothetical protein